MISENRLKDTRKTKTSGNPAHEGLFPDLIEENSLIKRNRAKTLSNRKQPLPDPEAFVLTEKKRLKPDEDNRLTEFYSKVPNTPMKRSQSDEERTQQERYNSEISQLFTTKILITQTKNSTLYRVTDTHHQVYALKELNQIFFSKKKQLQKSSLLEFRHAKILRNHPNIIRYENCIYHGPYISFQMEYLPGGTLAGYLEKNSMYDSEMGYEKDILWVFFIDLLNGLSYMHSKLIVHLDLKPTNILLTLRPGNNIPMLKIGDFGLSRTIGSVDKENFKKGDGRYLAPELLEPGTQITPAVDIFSLGICIYEMASDYGGSDLLWQNIINDHISYDRISKDLKPLLAQMLCKDPNLRLSASNCLLINDHIQKISKEYNLELLPSETTFRDTGNDSAYIPVIPGNLSVPDSEMEESTDSLERGQPTFERGMIEPQSKPSSIRKKLFQ